MSKKTQDQSSDILRILRNAEDVVKYTRKYRRSLGGNDYYANKFSELQGEAHQAIDGLKIKAREIGSVESGYVDELGSYVSKYFDIQTPAVERTKIVAKIRLSCRTRISSFGKSIIHVPTDNLLPLELVKNTRGYIETIAKQASGCYDAGWYDASAVMIRRLLEILIIHCFQANAISTKIVDARGNFLYLEDLISIFLQEHGKTWHIGRNTRNGLPRLKKIGDQSAHGWNFTAKKSDIDNLKEDLRSCIEELLNHSKLRN